MGDPALIHAGEGRKLSPRVVALWRMNVLLWAAALAMAGGIAGRLLGLPLHAAVTAMALAAAGAVLAIVFPRARYRNWVFAVGDADVVIRRGVWWRTTSIIPHSRIQHVDTAHGPLERKLGLSSVVIFTAGTVGASITIPGLPADEADELRDRLATLCRTGEPV